jgi:hypothetical protein
MIETSLLEGHGVIKCLRCKEATHYPSDWTCKCGNISIESSEDSDETSLYDHNDINSHDYAVYPDEFYEVGKKRVFVDMDDTLAVNEYPWFGKLNWPLINWLLQLPEEYEIYVWTCRLDPMTVGGQCEAAWHKKQLQKLLDKYGLKRFKIWTETIKPYAGITIDDNTLGPAQAIRAFKFFNGEHRTLHHHPS